MIFTGSYEVGMRLYRNFTRDYPRPIITEMGGKNPAIVTASADLDEAAEGVARSAFGFDGQKCSANSRVYVDRAVAAEFVQRLGERARAIQVGDPTKRENWMGPVINERLRKFTDAVAEARRDGGTIVAGGEVLDRDDEARGYYPTPTVVTGLPATHRLFRDELFVPFVVVAEVDLDEALQLANDTAYGLTAGIFSGDRRDRAVPLHHPGRRDVREPAQWRDHRGVARDPVVRRLEGSGSSGKSGLGPYYVMQFMREQSQTVMGEEPPPA